MNILQINATYGYKSTGVIMSDIGKLIDESGNNAFFAYQTSLDVVKNSIKIGNWIDWKIHAVLTRLFGNQGFYSSYPTLRLINFIKAHNIDVVHLHNLHSNYLNIRILLKFLSKNRIPVVITLHDCWWFTGKCFHYIDCSCSRFVSGCGNCPKKKHAPRSLFFDTSNKCWKRKKKLLLSIPHLTIVGCSKWICLESQKSFLKNIPTVQIYNGVDISVFKPFPVDVIKKEMCPHGEFLILGIANKWFLEENDILLKKIAQIKCSRIVIIGCTDQQIYKYKKMYPEFSLVGYINDKNEIAKYYNLADVFVNPTHADTLPTVNMESICCGTPVVTFSVGGSGELIDNETGIAVDENDFDALIRAIEQIRKKPLLKCSETGMMKFDKHKNYLMYLSLYNSISKSRVDG